MTCDHHQQTERAVQMVFGGKCRCLFIDHLFLSLSTTHHTLLKTEQVLRVLKATRRPSGESWLVVESPSLVVGSVDWSKGYDDLGATADAHLPARVSILAGIEGNIGHYLTF